MTGLLSIVIPVYNSQNTLTRLVDRLIEEMDRINQAREIILVDDGSRDDSATVIRHLCQEKNEVTGVLLAKNAGQQNAIMCGLRQARGQKILTMDDDLQHDPAEIGRLMAMLDQGYDLVYGIPVVKRHRPLRNLGTRLNDRLFGLILHKPTGIKVSSFRIMTDQHKDQLIRSKRSFVYLSAISLKLTGNIGNLLIHHRERAEGRSNYNYFKLMKLFLKLGIYYSALGEAKIFSKREQYRIKEVIRA